MLHLRHSSFSNPYFASPTSQNLLILQPLRHFTYVTTHSATLPSLYLRHSSFSNPSFALPTSFCNPFVASPTSQFISQPFFRFSYITNSAHSPTFPSLYLRHNLFSSPSVALPTSFSNPFVASPTSQFIPQPFFSFSYITSSAHSPTFPSLHLRHNSFCNPSVALRTSQFILQSFFRFSYVTSPSLNSPGEPPMNINCHYIRKHKAWIDLEINIIWFIPLMHLIMTNWSCTSLTG